MTMYTVMPPEQLWSGMWQEAEDTREVKVNGLLMQVRPVSETEAVIIRLLDCPLEAYLDASNTPGSRVPLSGN
ncbi:MULTISPECIES: YlzJ-like family protein [Paenibacillus]|uniref:YlzJ-like family protein n=1 Tax=Paenibacillus TaxID=44249 RepID=UPI000FE1E77D|nr:MULTISPECIES: YlzJ-like family protein [Paenibacillus]MCM3175354.1 YlzJ-like family protein [Paenibacillus sp. MER 99-2]